MSRQPALPAPHPKLCAVVVVPARDEAARIGACLAALASQRGLEPGSYEAVVVLDGCRDATASVVRQFAAGHPALAVHAIELALPQGVGRARRLGMDLAYGQLLSVGRADGLIASTDADSVVAADWLACQLDLAGRGARAIGGHIELDRAESLTLSSGALQERERRAGERMRSVLAHEPRREGVASASAHRGDLPRVRRAAGACGPRG
jgi:glucosyl-3-phosphoglycerate synthase